jgi:hypothetical protein
VREDDRIAGLLQDLYVEDPLLGQSLARGLATEDRAALEVEHVAAVLLVAGRRDDERVPWQRGRLCDGEHPPLQLQVARVARQVVCRARGALVAPTD